MTFYEIFYYFYIKNVEHFRKNYIFTEFSVLDFSFFYEEKSFEYTCQIYCTGLVGEGLKWVTDKADENFEPCESVLTGMYFVSFK